MLVMISFIVVKSFTNSKCLVDNATLIQLFKCEHSYLNFWKHSTNKQIDPCGWGSLTRSARRRRRGMNDAYMYTVLTLSLHFLTHYTVATYIWPTLYVGKLCENWFLWAKLTKNWKSLFFKIFDCKLFHWICLVETINLIPKFVKIGQ